MEKCVNQECPKYFHVLCAYVNGYAIDLIEYRKEKEERTKHYLRPEIRCLEHSKEQNVKYKNNF